MNCMLVWVGLITMPTSVRIGEEQLNHLASLARLDYSISGRVFMKNHENAGKWLQRWVALYQNFLFYFESEDSTKLSGVIYLEHCICERLCLTNLKESENQVSFVTPKALKLIFWDFASLLRHKRYHISLFLSHLCKIFFLVLDLFLLQNPFIIVLASKWK